MEHWRSITILSKNLAYEFWSCPGGSLLFCGRVWYRRNKIKFLVRTTLLLAMIRSRTEKRGSYRSFPEKRVLFALNNGYHRAERIVSRRREINVFWTSRWIWRTRKNSRPRFIRRRACARVTNLFTITLFINRFVFMNARNFSISI